MKALIFGAALLLVSMPAAFAQNQPTTTATTPPNSINHAPSGTPSRRSGAESQPAAHRAPAKIVGHSRYCAQISAHSLRCHYRTMASCKKSGHGTNLSCVANPRMAVGAAPRR